MAFKYSNYVRGIPDRHYSLRHYDFGPNIQLQDDDNLDDFYYETSKLKTKAVTEAKLGLLKQIDCRGYQASLLADRARLRNGTLPAFIVIYQFYKKDGTMLLPNEGRDNLSLLDHAQYLTVSVNREALKHTHKKVELFSEYDFVEMLYAIRKEQMPKDLQLYDEVMYYDSAQQTEILNKDYTFN